MGKTGSWNQTPAMGILGQCLDEEASSSRCVHAHPPHTSMGMPGQGCHTAQPVYFCSPVRAAHVITSAVAMWEEEGEQSLLQILQICTLRLSVSRCWQPEVPPILLPALSLGPLDA